MAETHSSPMTFTAGEALAIYTRVKLDSGSGTSVVYADQGEQAIGTTLEAAASGDLVAVQLTNSEGTVKVTANDTFSVGATLYAHDDGQVSDTSSGSAIGIALEACTTAGDIIEMVPYNVVSTTAVAVSVTDSDSIITATEVEAALAEAFTHIQSSQYHIPLPLVTWRQSASDDIPDMTDTPATDDQYGGLLHKGSQPILEFANGDTDSALRLNFANNTSYAIVNQRTLPPRFDVSADLVIHVRASMESTNDTPTIASDVYFNEGDTKVEDASAAVTGVTPTEYTITIAAADIPAGAQSVTVELTPGAHTTDDLYIYATWAEYTGTTLTL